MKPIIAIDIKIQHAGILQTMMLEFERHHLPRLLRLKDKVDRGEIINDVELDFLNNEIKNACMTKHMTFFYPELEEFCLLVGHLFKELCDKAVENELKGLATNDNQF